MSIITAKATLVENHFHSFYALQSDRLGYYQNVFQGTRNIFMALGEYDKLDELNAMIRNLIELPFQTKLQHIMKWYYTPRNFFRLKVWFKVGDRIDYVKVTKYEVEQRFEQIKLWCYDELSVMANDIRFSAIMPIQQ